MYELAPGYRRFPFHWLDFLCTNCGEQWDIQDTDCSEYRQVPCPGCGELVINDIFYETYHDEKEDNWLKVFQEYIDETAKWDAVDEFSKQQDEAYRRRQVLKRKRLMSQ